MMRNIGHDTMDWLKFDLLYSLQNLHLETDFFKRFDAKYMN